MLFQKSTVGFFVATFILLAACGGNSSAANNDGRLDVVATTGQIGDAVANIGGDAVELTTLLGPGIDPHLYIPTEGDVSAFSNADAIFYNGLNLEAQMTRVLDQLASRGKTVVAVGEALPENDLLEWTGGAYADPHVWNDPTRWSLGVEAIRDALIELDPENEAAYRTNADAYLEEIAQADAFAREQYARIPEGRRVLITAHDAFGYLGDTYGLEVLGLQGISTESEASTADVRALADLIVERQIPALFVETSVSPRTIESVQAAVRDQGFEVEIGGQLFSDALGETGSGAETYTGVLRANAQTIADALGE